ncbi:HlyD family secretion protein [Burkholderia plantarii]|uniref:HlyD family secretion protein n=1 Tax=Burkholderia plantarii TaxID=41899 RepID=UPI0008706DE2|nr:HlyD family secretion protein [Burkholderia plantarii]
MSNLSLKRKPYLVAVVVAAVLALGLAGFRFTRSAGETTNDAYVDADFSLVAPRVAGQIVSVGVEDNQLVRKGQLLAQIDDRDYHAAFLAAQADVAMAQAAVGNAAASLVEQQATIDQAGANLAALRANYAFAHADAERYADLAQHGAGSVQNAQQSRARVDASRADVTRGEASLTAAKQRVAVLQSTREHAEAALERARAALETARLNLGWTRITAPIDGMVGRRSVRVGAWVGAGTPLLAVVPLQRAYVVANFQETQLTDVRPGQRSEVKVDTLPGVVLRGKVDSVAPATGVTFAAIAPDNATGNFTKVVQRIPVKIVLDPGQPSLERLRVGMSVEASISTDDVHGNAGEAVAAR